MKAQILDYAPSPPPRELKGGRPVKYGALYVDLLNCPGEWKPFGVATEAVQNTIHSTVGRYFREHHPELRIESQRWDGWIWVKAVKAQGPGYGGEI